MENVYLRDEQSKKIKLGRRLGWGGQGEVHEVENDDSLVIKRFKEPTQELHDKISFMITFPPKAEEFFPNEPNHIFWTWPKKLIYTVEGGFDGYAMPKAQGQNGYDFMQLDSKVSWQSRLNIAFYLAKLVSSIHSASYVIGDLNPRNIFISNQNLPTIIDTDSFQVNNKITGSMLFPCPVADLEYAAPEAKDDQLNFMSRKVEGDYFSLSTYIFQLLMLGMHPYSGVAKNRNKQNIPTAIKLGESIFEEGLILPTKMPPLAILTPEIQRLFKRCFQEGHLNPAKRPNTTEWSKALGDVINGGLIRCSVKDRHFYSSHQKECPWCAYDQEHQFDPFYDELPRRKTPPPPEPPPPEPPPPEPPPPEPPPPDWEGDIIPPLPRRRSFPLLRGLLILLLIGLVFIVSLFIDSEEPQEDGFVLQIWEDLNGNGQKERAEPFIPQDQLKINPSLFQDEQEVTSLCPKRDIYTTCENDEYVTLLGEGYSVHFELPETSQYLVTAGGELIETKFITDEFSLKINSPTNESSTLLDTTAANTTDEGSAAAETNTITESYTHKIGLMKYASLAGKICLASGDNRECDEEIQDLASVLLGVEIEVEDKAELHEVTIDENGLFEIDNVFPGQVTWQVAIPDDYSLKIDNEIDVEANDNVQVQTLEFHSGETKDISIVLLPKIGPPPQIGTVTITSNPSGASVYLGNRRIGQTPLNYSEEVGLYNIRITKDGYEDLYASLRMEEGQVRRSFTLTPVTPSQTGTVIITSNPSGASVYLGNSFIGQTPFDYLEKVGSYNIRVILDGYEDLYESLRIEEGQVSRNFVLSPLPPPTPPPTSTLLPPPGSTFSISGSVCFAYPNERSCRQDVGAQFFPLISVTLWKDDVWQSTYSLSTTGTYNFTNLEPGNHEYKVVLDDSRFTATYPSGYILMSRRNYPVNLTSADEARDFRYQIGY